MTVFYFEGTRGTVDTHGFVLWGGMGFQVEAAKGGLARAIADAKADAAYAAHCANQ